jgi:glycosyltransferase involved in cell wall biosynthesis
MMQLDVIVPTFNRQELLKRALDSLLAADVPRGLNVRVTVVDNNSQDGTRRAVEERMAGNDGRLAYLFEGRAGKSNALNTGIASTQGELVGMIDDDEEIDKGWYKQVQRAFSDGEVDFIGGPYVPRWGAEPPSWLPMNYPAVIGWVESGDQVQAYGADFPGILMGGNAVMTRAILEKVGPYSTSLGPVGTRFLAGEDEDMYQRLISIGARGLYLPELRIYHYVPPERLTKRYYRRWCFWRGVSCGLIDRQRRSAVAYLGGVPRWLYGRAARGLLSRAKMVLSRNQDPAQKFSDELAVWDFAGFFYGKHFYREAR